MKRSKDNTPFSESRFYRWSGTRIGKCVLHSIFWFLFLLYLSAEAIASGGIEESCIRCLLLDNASYLLTTMLGVYVNAYVLVVNFLYKKNFMMYILSVFCLILLTSGIKVYLFNNVLGAGDIESIGFMETYFLWFFRDLFEVSGISSVKIAFDWINTKNKLSQKENQELEAEFRFLKAQVNPHFIFNTLNNIYFLTNKNSTKAGEAILSLSNILRYRIYERSEAECTIENEIECIKELIELEKLRNDETLKIELNTSGDFRGKKIEPLLFIPFIENAFKHCQMVNGGKFIKINFVINNNEVQFDCINSSTPQNPKKDLSVSGIGIKNVTNRLKLLYANKHNLFISSSPEIYSVNLTIKL